MVRVTCCKATAADVRPLLGPWSLRARLTVAATLTIATLLSTAAVLLVWRVHTGLLATLDASAEGQASTLAAAVAGSSDPRVPSQTGLNDVSQVVDASGNVVAASTEISGEPRLFDFAPAPADSVPVVRTALARPIDNAEYRVAAISSVGSPHYQVYVGLPLAEVTRSTHALATSLALGLPCLLVALGILTWVFAGRALRPMEELLNRLDLTLRRQRQFIADAAHELRSPVAAIRSQLEVADTIKHDGVPSLLTQESVRLSHLIDDLLALARIDSEPPHRREVIDLDDLVYDQAQLLRQRTSLIVDTRDVSASQVIGDPDLLTRAIRNLLDNAARYADRGIKISVSSTAQTVQLTVADDGPGIPEPDRARVLQRFTRLDDARTRETGGVGLGLAIANDVVTIHGGRLHISDNAPGARITITLFRPSADKL